MEISHQIKMSAIYLQIPNANDKVEEAPNFLSTVVIKAQTQTTFKWPNILWTYTNIHRLQRMMQGGASDGQDSDPIVDVK